MLAYFPLTGQGSHFYLEYQYLPVRYIENVCFTPDTLNLVLLYNVKNT